MELFGVKELDDFFASLTVKQQAKIIQQALKKGTKPLVITARKLLKSRMKSKSRTKNLEKSVGFVPMKVSSKAFYISAKVGARRSPPYRGFHGHLYDAGTVERTTKKGFSRGKMPATHFFTEAVNTTRAQTEQALSENIVYATNKYVENKLKNYAKAYGKAHGN